MTKENYWQLLNSDINIPSQLREKLQKGYSPANVIYLKYCIEASANGKTVAKTQKSVAKLEQELRELYKKRYGFQKEFHNYPLTNDYVKERALICDKINDVQEKIERIRIELEHFNREGTLPDTEGGATVEKELKNKEAGMLELSRLRASLSNAQRRQRKYQSEVTDAKKIDLNAATIAKLKAKIEAIKNQLETWEK